ncbi:thiamine phosphate synthase [Paenibacillus chartarius]|uniref:Thiamine-phosphate synthase n=1 Tax=Paenibacillus chartarius TaxID=747481 RepID=A0ABV6DPP7_9BACL
MKETADARFSRRLAERLRLYFVMGSVNCRQDPVLTLEAAIRGGITAFQYREKGRGALTGDDREQLGVKLRELCRAHNVLFMVNDDVELALRLEADGVHVGQEDEAAAIVRRRMPAGILGVSAHDVLEAEEAVRCGADYLGVGPMYMTRTKPDIREVRGPGVIRDIRASGLSLPIVGIGGIEQGRAEAVVRAGADGVAVISAIAQAEEPRQAAERLLTECSPKFA